MPNNFYAQQFLCPIICSPRQSCRLWYNVEKYFTVRQATDDNTAHVHCVLDTYKHTLRTRNTCCFPTATIRGYTYIACIVKV
jgi:hypothetical protein